MNIGTLDIIVFILIGLGVLFALIRMLFGPKLGDRVVALDTINIIVIGIIVLIAKILEKDMYLDIAIIYAILAFLETVVFARYLEGRKWK